MISESGWLEDRVTNIVYKQSYWEVVGSTGNLYQVSLDDRKPYPQCTCKAGLHGKKCYHADAVKLSRQLKLEWSAEKNTFDLARNDGF